MNYLTVYRLRVPNSIPGRGGVFHEIFFSLADHTQPTRSGPTWHKMAQCPFNGTTQHVDIEKKGRHPTTDRQWPKEI